MLVNRQTINCAFAFSCKKFALFELTDPMRRKIFVQMFLQGEARLIALQVPKERLSGNLTSIGRICSNPLCLAGQYFLTGLWLKSIDFLNSLSFICPEQRGQAKNRRAERYAREFSAPLKCRKRWYRQAVYRCRCAAFHPLSANNRRARAL